MDGSKTGLKSNGNNGPTPLVKSSIYALGISGCLAPILYSLQAATLKEYFSVLSFSMMISACALLVGGLIGFLFGIPKLGNKNSNSLFIGNTNLEQISDWLTKVLVGIGLSQLSSLKNLFNYYMDQSQAGYGNFPSCRLFACCVLIYFSVGGFFIGFLLTKLYMERELLKAENEKHLLTKELSDNL